jgi:hypothetical protein
VLIGVPGQLTRPVFDLRIGDGAVGDRPARLCPGSVGARGDLAALPAQDSADQLDRVAFGTHLIGEHGDQRLRGLVKSARSAVPAWRLVRFCGPLPEPGVHLSMHRALHKPTPSGVIVRRLAAVRG